MKMLDLEAITDILREYPNGEATNEQFAEWLEEQDYYDVPDAVLRNVRTVEEATAETAKLLDDGYFERRMPDVRENRTSDAVKWIPVSERLPEELETVNITWINHNPESYYADIKGKPFTATGVYFNGQWYWWSTLCTDILAEYSHNYDDVIDDDIEIIAWQPLPEPYKVEPQERSDNG